MAKLVTTNIYIGKTHVTQFTELQLIQSIFAHHHFKIVCPGDLFTATDPFAKTKTLIGERCTISIANFEGTGKNLEFIGLVTNVATHKFGGHKGDTIIQGYSPTIVMDNMPHCKSWEGKSFKSIVNDVSSVFASNEVVFSTKVKTTIFPYIVQYKETAWQFLNRMAAEQGEWLFYNGKKIILGAFNTESTALSFGSNLNYFSVGMQLRPPGFSHVAYNYENDEVYNVGPHDIAQQAGLNDLGQYAYNKSKEFFSSEPKSYTAQYINNKSQLYNQVQHKAAAQSANHITFTGSSTHFGVQLGKQVNISDNYGNYQIIEVTHSCDGQGNYNNDFTAIPATIQVPPVTHYAMPFSETQTGVVIANHDGEGLGRIRVRLRWMNQDEQTPWVRMVHPHAGGGKGVFFIPEIGEEVKVAFENGDPTKPYVTGTIYNGGASSDYSNSGNDLKVIETRSGTMMKFNDAEGSIFVKDPSGNTWFMDGKGNIKVNAPNNMSIQVGKDLDITVGANMTTRIGANETITVGNNKTENIAKNYIQFSDNKNVTVKADKTERVGNSYKQISGDSDIQTSKGDLKIRGTALTVVQGGKDVKVSKG